MSTYLSHWLDDVASGISDGIDLYDVVLDLRDVADKNPALTRRLREIAEKIDSAVKALVVAHESFIDVQSAIDSMREELKEEEELAA